MLRKVLNTHESGQSPLELALLIVIVAVVIVAIIAFGSVIVEWLRTVFGTVYNSLTTIPAP